MERLSPTERTTLKRLPKRGVYDRAEIYRILDEGFICHVGFAIDGRPFVIPTGYARAGELLYVHGSAASRMLKALSGGIEVCVTVTLVDGIVLARSAFHSSMNYRSVVIFGVASLIDEPGRKLEALTALSEHIIPGRWDEVRKPTESEMQATTVLAVPLQEASAKVRTGPPIDDEEDYQLNVWAGELPLGLVTGSPKVDQSGRQGIPLPGYVLNYRR
jgi:nitroimidazol reductase NimA-like FMN-containing flavoprotein (pyridoxamine 5'-phosphate oxidase superfamily)